MTKNFFKIERNAKLNAAIERAKAGNLFVRPTVIYRRYIVINRETGATYTVEFAVKNGVKLGRCSCPATTVCKHIAASVGLHVCLAKQRAHQTRKAHASAKTA